jgi:ubiquinone/menaquinone biosynthesis C-methylase UbiE
VACGTGSLLQKAQIAGMQCFGIDNSPGMLAQAQEKVPSAEFLRASFYEIPYPDATFDYVVETNAVSGVDIDVESVLKEMVRVCKENGQILIGD